MRNIISISLSVLLLSTLFSSCTQDEVTENTTTIEDCSDDFTYNADIANIISTNCAGCHNSNLQFPNLTTYAEVETALERVEARALVSKSMPPSGPLTEGDQEKLDCWIKQGNPED